MIELGNRIVREVKRLLASTIAPNNRTGKLKRSLKVSKAGDDILLISGEDYAIHLNDGTRHIKATLFLEKAVDNELKKIDDLISEVGDDLLKEL